MTTDAQATLPIELKPSAIIVQQGKVLDFIDGHTQRDETPEEYVRQEIAKSLVREYGYAKADIEVEFTLRLGTRKPRADIVIFPNTVAHLQEKAQIIVECKAKTVKSADRKEGVGQLESYMAACPNVTFGMWTNGVERFCFRRLVRDGKIVIEEVPDIPEYGRGDEEAERPRFEQLKPATSDALLFAFRRCHNYIAGIKVCRSPKRFGNSSSSSSAKFTMNETATRWSSMQRPTSGQESMDRGRFGRA
jgi:type I restriction enzyme M protein